MRSCSALLKQPAQDARRGLVCACDSAHSTALHGGAVAYHPHAILAHCGALSRGSHLHAFDDVCRCCGHYRRMQMTPA